MGKGQLTVLEEPPDVVRVGVAKQHDIDISG
jgi:hypothetical protein